MVRYCVTVEYDGTDFCGYQRQAQYRTVQAELEAALQRLNKGLPVVSHAAGRTDSGVHALGQVVAFDLPAWRHDLVTLERALNAHLPKDVAVREARVVATNFLPRFAAQGRCYRYQIYPAPQRSPLHHRSAWQVWPPLVLESMQEATVHLLGRHDFATFGTPPVAGGHTVRTIYHASWQYLNDLLVFEIAGDAFLYHMVRNIVGTLCQVGRGELAPAVVAEYLAARKRAVCAPPAPPHGLILWKVLF